MKKDMTEKRDVVNGNLDYTNGNVYNNIEQRLNIKRITDSRDCSELESKAGVTTQDAQNQASDKTYVKMTIKKIIKDKIMEMQSFDTGQLQTKLIRMEEENFNLRNRAIALEERIKFLEKQCRSKDIKTEGSSPSQEDNDIFEIQDNSEHECLLDFSVDLSSAVSEEKRMSPVQSATIDRTIDNERTSPSTTPNVSNAITTESGSVTSSNIDMGQNDAGSPKIKVSTEVCPAIEVKSESIRESPVARVQEASTSSSNVSPSQIARIQDASTSSSNVSPSQIAGLQEASTSSSNVTPSQIARVQEESTSSSDVSPSQIAHVQEASSSSSNVLPSQIARVQEASTSSSNVSPSQIKENARVMASESLPSPRSVKIASNTASSSCENSSSSESTISSRDLIRPRNKEISPERKDVPSTTRDIPRTKPKEVSISSHGPKSKETFSKNSFTSIGEPSISGGGRPIPSLVPISLYNPNPFDGRNSMVAVSREPPNLKVEMYEKQLLGQISPKSYKNSKRPPAEMRVSGKKDYSREINDKLLVRTARDYYKLNENISNSGSYYPPYKPPQQMPRSSSESSIYSSNVARDDLDVRYGGKFSDNHMARLQNPSNFKQNEIMVGNSPRTVRDFVHKEIPNERKIEKVLNPYMNGFTAPRQPMQGVSEPYQYSTTNVRYDNPNVPPPRMEMQRYETNRTLGNFTASPNSLSKQPLKRPSPGYSNERTDGFPVEYEPLSKVSPKPPPLIPGHNLSSSTTHFPGRHMRIPNEQMGAPKYPPQTSAKYNISATNFHATSRIPSTYQMTNPNYMSSPNNFPSNFDNRLALPQLVAHITSDKSSIIFTWDKVNNASHMFIENVDVYFLFAFHTLDLNQPPPKETSYWKRISIVNPLPLPIACTLTQSFDGQNYFFAVAAVNRAGGVGQLSNPCALKVAL